MRRYGLRGDQRYQIAGVLRGCPGTPGITASDNFLSVEAILYQHRTGIPRRDVLERFSNWKNIHRRFSRWAETCVREPGFYSRPQRPIMNTR